MILNFLGTLISNYNHQMCLKILKNNRLKLVILEIHKRNYFDLFRSK